MDEKDLKVHWHSVINKSVFFQIVSNKHGEAASWFKSDWKLKVIYVTKKFVHANLLGKLLLTSIRHTALQPSMYLSGWLCMCGKLPEVCSKCCLTDCCSQTVDKAFKITGVGSATYTALQRAHGLKALLQYTLTASFFPLLPTYVHLYLLTFILKM